MYSSYSPLQRRQLREQTYTDTQSTYLLVYAPGRRNALTLSLAEQLHRKFRLVDRLEGELTPSVNGVLLVSEDVECTSTALTYFAAALQQGADLVVCDAVFGYDGGSALYQTDQHLPGQRCALLSRALLDRCRAAARGKDDVLELLRLANQLAQNCRCVPQALLHFRRELCAEDVFSATGKRAVVLSHELTMTGAPIVLVSAIPVLRSLGYEVVVLGPSDEGSLPLFLEAGAAVVTRRDCVTSSTLWELASSADFVLANTVVEAPAVSTLNGGFVPVLWWLHDAFAGYPFITHKIPKELADNVHIAAVGSHATAAMHSVRPKFKVEQLDLRPARLRPRELPSLRPELCRWAAPVCHGGLHGDAQGAGHLLRSHPSAAAEGAGKGLLPLCGQGFRPGRLRPCARPDRAVPS